MRSSKQKPSATADPRPAERLNAALDESDARRLGRRLMLKFVGEEVPVLERIEFRPKQGADSEFWERGHANKSFSWTEVPQALAILFAEYSAWGKAGQHADFFFAGACRGSLAASLGDAIHKKDDRIHELFVEAVASGKTVSRVKLVFGGSKGDNVHGKAKDKRDRRIAVNANYLPPDCVDVIWERSFPPSATEVVDVRLLANRIRESLGLPADKSGQVPESFGQTVGKEESLLRTPATPGPQQPLGDAPTAKPVTVTGLPEENIPEPLKELFEEAGKLAEMDKDGEAKAKYEEAANHPDAVSRPTFRLKTKIGVASVLRRHAPDESRKLFLECLRELPDTASDRLREDLFGRLGELEAHTGNLLEAKAYLTEAQKFATRLGNKISLACNLEALAALEDRHGKLGEAIALFDQAAELLMSEYQRHDSETEKQALMGLGICLTNKSLTQKRQADLLGALSSLEQAVEWFRKGDIQDDHFAETMLLFAEAKFADEKWDEGLQLLQESLRSAKQRDDYMGICKCLKLSGKVRFTFGDEAGALGNFAAALDLMRKRGRPDQLLDYLDKVARVAAKHGLKDEARKLLIEAKEIAQKHERLEDCADAVLELAELEDGPDADAKRKEALRIAIGFLEKLLPKTQVKGRKAFLSGRIGFLHQRLGDLDVAQVRFSNAKQLYEQIGDVWGIVNSLGSLADIKRLQNKPDEEMNLCRQVLTIAEGKPLGDFIARAKNNMGVRLMETGFLRDAQQVLKEADELCRRKHFRELHQDVMRNVERVQRLIEAHKPAAMNFADLIRELHELGDFFPEAKESILMFWYYWRDIELHSNCRSLLGVKLLVSEDDSGKFLEVVDKLAAYSDLNLQVLTTEYPGYGMDFVPWPKDKPVPDRVAKAQVRKIGDADEGQLLEMRFVRGGMHWPYFETSDAARSKQSGREAIVIGGHARGLPLQAHELMFGQTADTLIAKKVAFFPWDRSSTESRLADDLSLAKEQSLIPLYADQLPGTEDVEEIAHVAITFPVVAPDSPDQIGRQVAEIKRRLVRLLSLKDDAAVAELTEIAGRLDELQTASGTSERIRMIAYLLRFPVHGALQTHLALVRQSS